MIAAHYATLGPRGEDWREEKKISLTRESLRRHFRHRQGDLLVMEVGAHSRWVKQVLEELGLEVFVAHAAEIPGIARSTNKHDRADARQLARLGRADCGLLRRTQHRRDAAQHDLLLIRSRAALVKARSELIICARGLLKSFGERVAVSGSDYFAPVALETLPELVSKPLSGLLQAIASLTEQILDYDKSIEQAAERYPEVACITTVPCIGTLTALSFVLTVEIHQELLAAGLRAVSADYDRSGANRASGTRNWAFQRLGTVICEPCWCSARIIYSDGEARIVLYDVGGWL